MKEYDVIIIGTGAGMSIGEKAAGQELNTAVVDQGPAGGTCLNVGCIPSKLLITSADRVMEIKEAEKLGIDANIENIDFSSIMNRMHEYVDPIHERIRDNLREAEEIDFYETQASFVDEHLLEVDDRKIYGEKIYLASGSRPFIPEVEGLSKVDYLTNETLLDLNELPESMVIIGGGYIAAEYGHFFSSMGTDVSIMQADDRLVPNEEPEISELLEKKLSERMQIYTSARAEKVEETADGYRVIGENGQELTGKEILVAAGRASNADLLNVQATEVETDDRGYIKVNEYFETSKEGIWAFGDAIGKEMFTHVSREEAEVVWHNSMHQDKKRIPFDYSATPHAIFTRPQIASCGMTEKEAEKEYKILVGKAYYKDVAKGAALREDGFAKAIVNHENGSILGFHIIGPYAPILIQEVINAMAIDGTPNHVVAGMHIHPAMTELVSSAFGNLSHPEDN